jgi:2'-5' RNA ligase
MDTKSLIQIPGYRYNEYLLILNPHEDLRNKIIQVKKEFADKYKAPTAKYGKPHITLINFIQFEMMEDRVVNSLKTIAMGYTPFKVELKDFGSFPSHTIFINIESKQQVQNLVKELRSAQRLMTLNKENKPHFIDNPYLTVARKLLPWQYEQGWLEYSNRHFAGRFIADGMLLIKLRVEEKAYQIVQLFEFMNLPVTTKQGELFM